jgi:carbonic anhydrase/acetyltransferase-like protein (isoleucine patch superfamily)
MVGLRHARALNTSTVVEGNRRGAGLRVAWTILSCAVVVCLVFALAVWPAGLMWVAASQQTVGLGILRPAILGAVLVPIYLVFALALMACSTLATRLLGWRVAAGVETRITDFDWPLLDWVRQMVLTHVVRVCAGTLLRATPLWTLYLRMNGARLGKGVYVNSLGVSDHHLLEFGNHVVVGGAAHISGHTVENGRLRTALVRLGDHVVVGTGSVVGIGVEVGSGCQIGALTFVPKFTKLPPNTAYLGVPLHVRHPPDSRASS